MLLLRYSRTRDVPLYITSVLVCVVEVIKLIFSFSAETIHQKSVIAATRNVLKHTIYEPYSFLLMIVPSALYAVQNNMTIIALSNLDVVTFQITYQLKILTTAMFSVFLLGRHLTAGQWKSLILLVVGVGVIQIESAVPRDSLRHQNKLLGILMIFLSTMSSGFAGVYFEKIVKQKTTIKVSPWIRNIQLGLFGLLFSVFLFVGKDFEVGLDAFRGFDQLVVLVAFSQAFGGILVSLVIAYADNVLKGFAISISIVLSTSFTYFHHGEIPSLPVFVGTILVVFSIILFNISIPKQIPISISSNNKTIP